MIQGVLLGILRPDEAFPPGRGLDGGDDLLHIHGADVAKNNLIGWRARHNRLRVLRENQEQRHPADGIHSDAQPGDVIAGPSGPLHHGAPSPSVSTLMMIVASHSMPRKAM